MLQAKYMRSINIVNKKRFLFILLGEEKKNPFSLRI